MRDLRATVDGVHADPPAGWRVEWADRGRGIGRLIAEGRAIPVVVEGDGTTWFVTIRGRRIPVIVQTWRERIMAEAESAAQVKAGPVLVTASLPGLVVAVAVVAGDTVEAGQSLLTIEAMKMQNEVRAPRAGRIIEVSVAAGTAVATGLPLLRLE